MIERAIVEAALALRTAGEPFVIATVVAVTGSAYRRPGARMLIARDRWVAGSVSGGCLEGDVLRRSWWRTENGRPMLVTYDSTVTDDADPDALREGLGLGCNGIVDVLLERDGDTAPLPFAFLARCLERQQRGALVTVFESADPAIQVGDRLAIDASGATEGELAGVTLAFTAEAHRAMRTGVTTVHEHRGVRALVEAVVPPPRLFVLGAGHDAVPLVELGRGLGWEVFVGAASQRPDVRARFIHADHIAFGAPAALLPLIDGADRAACVVMNHDYERDLACLSMLFHSSAAYIGVLGPRRRTSALLGELEHGGDDPRLHAPVGLALGAETPAEIALAIAAEIQAKMTIAVANSLRERGGPIHAATNDAGAGVRVAASCEAP